MSSRQRKDELRAARDADERERELSRVRQPHDDVRYPGAGGLVLRLLVFASFKFTICWEVRELGGELLLFRSRSPEPDAHTLVGEARLPARSEDLRALLDEFRGFSLPVFPEMKPFAVADGGRIEIVLCAGWDTRWHVSWSDGFHPPEWSRLVEHVAEVLERLRRDFPE